MMLWLGKYQNYQCLQLKFRKKNFLTLKGSCNQNPYAAVYKVKSGAFRGIRNFLYNIHCGYTIEPPYYNGSNKHPKRLTHRSLKLEMCREFTDAPALRITPKSGYREIWHMMSRFIYTAAVLIYTKCQLATSRGTLKFTAYKNVNLSLTGSYMYRRTNASTNSPRILCPWRWA